MRLTNLPYFDDCGSCSLQSYGGLRRTYGFACLFVCSECRHVLCSVVCFCVRVVSYILYLFLSLAAKNDIIISGVELQTFRRKRGGRGLVEIYSNDPTANAENTRGSGGRTESALALALALAALIACASDVRLT